MQLSPADVYSHEAQVATDAQGEAVAVWVSREGSSEIVESASRPAGGAWQEPVRLSAAGGEWYDPEVAIDAQGDAVAVWDGRREDNNPIVEAASRPPGGAWQEPVQLSPASAPSHDPRVAIDALGDAIAVWVHGSGIVEAASRPPGGAWQEPVRLSPVGEFAERARVAIDAQGEAVAVWEGNRAGDRLVQVVEAASRPAGGSWQEPVQLGSAGGPNSAEPQVAIDADGDALAVWNSFNGSNRVAQAAPRPAGGAWQEAVQLSPASGESFDPQTAIDAQGDAVAVWEERYESGDNISEITESASRPAGGAWQEPVQLSAAIGHAERPRVVIDAQDDAVAVWEGEGYKGASHFVEAASRPAGGAWQEAVALSAAGPEGGEQTPAVAIDAQGEAVAVWNRWNGITQLVEAADYAATPGVTGVSPDAGFESGGTEVTITGSELGEATMVRFGSTGATSFRVNSPTSITAVAPPQEPGTVHVTVTNADGTSTTRAANEFTYVAPGPGPGIEKLSVKKGPAVGGTQVTITGTSLLGVTAVKFGSAEARSFAVNSATSITAVSPAGTTGPVAVSVTTPNGTSTISSKDRFTYEAPTVTSVSPDSGSTAGGNSVTITGSGFALGSTTSFKFEDAIAMDVNCNSTTECTMLSPAAAKARVVDVRAKVGGKTSRKDPPADQFEYS